ELPKWSAHWRPRRSGVARFGDPSAEVFIAAIVGLPGSDINDVWISGIERDRADRKGWLVIGQCKPVLATVGRLPDSTSGSAQVDHIPVSRIDGQRGHSPGEPQSLLDVRRAWTNQPPSRRGPSFASVTVERLLQPSSCFDLCANRSQA